VLTGLSFLKFSGFKVLFFKVLLLLPPVDIFLWSNGDMFLISPVRAREKFGQVVIPDGNIKTISQAIEKYFFLFLKCF